MTTSNLTNYRPYTQENLISDLFAGRERMDPNAAQQVSDAMQFLSMSGGGLDYWTTLMQHLGSYADQLGAIPGSYQASRYDDAQEAVKEFYLAKDIAQGKINSTQANDILRAYNAQQNLDSKQRLLQNDKNYLAAIEKNPSLVQGGMTPEYMRNSIARQEAYINQQQGVIDRAKEGFKDVSPSSLEFTQAMGATPYSFKNAGEYNFDTERYGEGETSPRNIPDFLGGTQAVTDNAAAVNTATQVANKNISLADASAVFQKLFGRAPNQQELANFASVGANDPRLASTTAFENYLKGTTDYADYIKSITNTGTTDTTKQTVTPGTTDTTKTTKEPSTVYQGVATQGQEQAKGAGLSALQNVQAQTQGQSSYPKTYGFKELYQAPTELATSRGLGQLLSEAKATPLELITRTIGKSGISEPKTYSTATKESTTESRLPYSDAAAIYAQLFGIAPTPLQRSYFEEKQKSATPFKSASEYASFLTSSPDYLNIQSTNKGISSIAPPPLSYATPGFTAPSQGGLAAASAPGGIGQAKYYENIATALNQGLSPVQVADAMRTYGVTADDLIAARSKFAGVTGGTGGAGAPISVASTTTAPSAPDQSVLVSKTGGVIALAEGGKTEMAGEKKFSFEDFGLTPATVELARKRGIFDVPRDVLFNPELKGLEAAALAGMPPAARELARRQLMIRQGRTGAEYFPANMFESTRPAFDTPEGAIDPRTGRPIPYRPEYLYQYAEGGDVGRGLGSIAMKGYAQEMAQKGRFGDTMLAHISPEEAQMLQAAGGAGTINPQTGLPEYFSWRKLLKGVGKVLPFVLPFTGIGLGAQALISGLSGAVSGGKGFDFKRGLMSGLMSYGMGSLAQGAGAAGTDVGATQGLAGADLSPTVRADIDAGMYGNTASEVAKNVGVATPSYGNVFDSSKGFLPQLGENIQAVGQGAMGAATGAPGAREAFTAGQGSVFGKQLTPTMAAGATAVGMGGVKAADEMNAIEAQQAALAAKTQEEKQYYEDLFRRLMGGFAGGGEIAAMVAGGATGPANEPRTINGAGDGMSDSVPATIEGVQEARLADGEFVIPADVVADLGNGSSNAGSKKLYAMMDRVRKARHGTTRQPPEVDTGRLMPA